MSISGIGRADDLEKYWSPELTENTDRLEIDTVEKSHVEAKVDGYPYSNQVVLSGEFTYHQPGRRGYSPTANGQYEYRAASGLFLLNIQQANMDAEKVFKEINSAIAESAEVRPIKAVDRQSLWSFFKEADEIIDAEIQSAKGGNTLRNLIKSKFTQPTNQSEKGIHEFEGDLSEYLLTSIKAKFATPEAEHPFIVKYNKGRFTIPAEPEAGAEYIVQLLEREILHHNEN